MVAENESNMNGIEIIEPKTVTIEKNGVVRKTGLIWTIGPENRSVEMLQEMIMSGMNVARLNFSHETHKYHEQTIENISDAVESFHESKVVAIALDTKGPEIRTGFLKEDGSKDIELVKDSKVKVLTDEEYKQSCTDEQIFIDYKNITKVLDVGSKVLLDHGRISLTVLELLPDALICKVENGGLLGNRKRVDLPGAKTDLPVLSPEDIQDLKFAVEQEVDIIFASFIRSAEDIIAIRHALGTEGKDIKIMAKIENQEGIQNSDEIIEEADGIIVAQLDLKKLKPEVSLTQQKLLMAKCNKVGKPVICSTQLLESDVTNAVLNGADCVMFNGEMAKSDYPPEGIKIMHTICKEAEAALCHTKFFEDSLRLTSKPANNAQTMAIAAMTLSHSCNASAILLLNQTGRTAALLSKFRPICPILVLTRSGVVARQMNLRYGVFPIIYPEAENPDWTTDVDNRINYGVVVGKNRGFVGREDSIVVVTGWWKDSEFTTALRIMVAHSNPLSSLGRTRILITGALGQLGQGLAKLLRTTYGRDNVIMSDIVKPARRLWTLHAPYIYVDVLDADALEAAVVKYKINWIVHFSAILSAIGEKNVPLAVRINIEGLHNVLEVSIQHKVRLFVPSTIGAFGPSSPRVQTPDVTIQRPRTIYGISKVYAELLGDYLFEKFQLDFRSLRFPGIISQTKPGGGTTDYAIQIYYDALTKGNHICYLGPDTRLPMMYIDDCLRSVVETMEAPGYLLKKRIYNVAAMSFSPSELAAVIKNYIPAFQIEYDICPVRQAIADSWPQSLDDQGARDDWGWNHEYNITRMTETMLHLLGKELNMSHKIMGKNLMERVNVNGSDLMEGFERN